MRYIKQLEAYTKNESVKDESGSDETKSEVNDIEEMRRGRGSIVRPNRVHE